MLRRSALFLLLLGACRHLDSGVPMDPQLAASVPAVLRVSLVRFHGGSKIYTETVKVLRVLKDSTGADFPEQMAVGHPFWDPEVPPGESTIYLELDDAFKPPRWMLRGISHAETAGTLSSPAIRK